MRRHSKRINLAKLCWTAILVYGLTLPLGAAPAKAQALKDLFTGLVEGVGWALSAIGLEGGSSETNGLESLQSTLETIDTDIQNMETQLPLCQQR